MGIYDELSDVTYAILKGINDSPRVNEYLRLVGYDGKDALTGSPTLPNFNELMWERQFPFIKPLDPTTDQGTYVMVYFENGGFSGANNVYQHDTPFVLEFFSHEDVWGLNGAKTRPYELLGVLYEAMSNVRLPQAIRGKLVVGAPKLRVIHNGKYAGYRFELKLTGTTGC